MKELCDELGSESAIYKATDVTSKDEMHALAKHGIDTLEELTHWSIMQVLCLYHCLKKEEQMNGII